MTSSPQSTAADWLVDTFKKNPEGLLLLAAGAVLMIRHGGSKSMPAVASKAASQVSDVAAGVRDYVADVTDRTLGEASSLTSTTSEFATQAAKKVTEHSERVVQQAQSTMQNAVNHVLKNQPLGIAVAGLAAGAAIASIFPATDFEKETLGPIGDQVTDAAARVGEQLKQATAAAGETLRGAADQRGLNVEGLKRVATEVADAVKESMSGGEPKTSNPPNRSY